MLGELMRRPPFSAQRPAACGAPCCCAGAVALLLLLLRAASFPPGLASTSEPCPALRKLASGELHGATELDLAGCGLTELPTEVRALAPTLTRLNLAHNRLSALPPWLPELRALRVLFLLGNRFEEVPAVVGLLPAIFMLSLRANRVRRVDSAALAPTLGWLILTENRIEQLPPGIGRLTALRKLMLSDNRLSRLPEEMRSCSSLEVLRLATNRLTEVPPWLLQMPRLAWIALAGNPATASAGADAVSAALPEVDWAEVQTGHLLGEGTSGRVYHAEYKGASYAAKEYKAEMSSDGTPGDEIAATLIAQSHQHIISAAARIRPSAGRKQGILLGLVDHKRFRTAGRPPSFATVTRDTFPEGYRVSPAAALATATGVAAAMQHVHSRRLAHGDLYLHNVLADGAGVPLLGDFGAAFPYGGSTVLLQGIEKVEVRAFGCLVDDLLSVTAGGEGAAAELVAVREDAMAPSVAARPSFAALAARLEAAAARG